TSGRAPTPPAFPTRRSSDLPQSGPVSGDRNRVQSGGICRNFRLSRRLADASSSPLFGLVEVDEQTHPITIGRYPIGSNPPPPVNSRAILLFRNLDVIPIAKPSFSLRSLSVFILFYYPLS